MRNHIPQCWGAEIWNNAKDLELDPAKEIIRKSRTMKNVKLTKMLARLPESKETFSLSPPSREEIRYVPNLLLLCLLTSFPSVTIAHWVSESMRPLSRTEASSGSARQDDHTFTYLTRRQSLRMLSFSIAGQSVS